jgi:hypothetical protein
MNLEELLEAHELAYFATPKRKSSPATYNTDFTNIYKKIPRGEPVSPELLRQTLEAIPDDTRTRKRAAHALQHLATFAGFDTDLAALSGDYSKPEPRDLPSDEAIAAFFPTIQNPKWRWVYGAIATYGLRPHEALFLRVNADGTANVLDGKTGPRKVWPYLPEWHYAFSCQNQRLPSVTTEGRTFEQIGRSVIKYLRSPRVQCPWKIYNIRHAWAVRTMALGMKDHIAAKEMGHSVEVHQRIYQAWISEREHAAAFAEILRNRSSGR